MSQIDPIAMLISRTKNAIRTNAQFYKIRYSVLFERILKVFLKEGYIRYYKISTHPNKRIFVYLKYKNESRISTIQKLVQISKPGCRIYSKISDLRYLSWNKVFILSTSIGILSHKDALSLNVGGELLLRIQ